jgi:hypothetical protein
VDRETGVNYLYHVSGYSGGLTPLLDREGKPVISPVRTDYEDSRQELFREKRSLTIEKRMVKESEAPVYGTLQSSFSSVFCFVRTDFYFFRRRAQEQYQENVLKTIFLQGRSGGPVRFSGPSDGICLGTGRHGSVVK